MLGPPNLILGLGAWWCELEFRAFDDPYDHRVGRFEEALTIVADLRRNGHMDFEGTYYQVRHSELRPRGPRLRGPPILVGSSSSGKRMLRLAARHADIWNRDFDAVNPGFAPLFRRRPAGVPNAGRCRMRRDRA